MPLHTITLPAPTRVQIGRNTEMRWGLYDAGIKLDTSMAASGMDVWLRYFDILLWRHGGRGMYAQMSLDAVLSRPGFNRARDAGGEYNTKERVELVGTFFSNGSLTLAYGDASAALSTTVLSTDSVYPYLWEDSSNRVDFRAVTNAIAPTGETPPFNAGATLTLDDGVFLVDGVLSPAQFEFSTQHSDVAGIEDTLLHETRLEFIAPSLDVSVSNPCPVLPLPPRRYVQIALPEGCEC